MAFHPEAFLLRGVSLPAIHVCSVYPPLARAANSENQGHYAGQGPVK